MNPSLQEFLAARIERVEERMRGIVAGGADGALQTMLRYHLGFSDAQGRAAHVQAGKRIRPALVLLSSDVCGRPGEIGRAEPAAAAVELLHNFSLIHDDIEDRDELRRGRPTLWKVWGIAQAINTGDAMFAMAHLSLLASAFAGVSAARVLRAMRVFDEMCVDLTRGQHLDLGFEQRTDVTTDMYLDMIGGKTAALTQACCAIGGIVGGGTAAQVRALAAFGLALGLAFQIQDDALGIWGDPAQTGKAGNDLAHRKKSYPVLIAAARDPAFRDRYFSGSANESDLPDLRRMIDATGARALTEAAAAAAYARGLASLKSLGGNSEAVSRLEGLAQALFGRAA